MISQNTDDILCIFQTRLITLGRILGLGERALPDRARSCIEGTRALLTAIECDDSRPEESKRTELGSCLYCVTSVRLSVSDFLMPLVKRAA